MRKDFEIFSKDELASLQNFAKNAKKEDKKLHGIQDNKINNNKPNINIPKKEEKKPQPPVKKFETPKQVVVKPPPVKKEEIKKVEQPKPIQKQIKKEEKPPKKVEHPVITSPPPKVVYAPVIFPEPHKIEPPKELKGKIPENATFKYADPIPPETKKKDEHIKPEIKNKVEIPKKVEPIKSQTKDIQKNEPPKPPQKKFEQPKPQPPKIEPPKPPIKIEPPKPQPQKIEPPKPPQKIEPPKPQPKKIEQPKPPQKKFEQPKPQPKKIEQPKPQPTKIEPPKQPKIESKNGGGFSNLRDTLIKNMQTRDKPVENKPPSEPIKVVQSDAMKNMVEAMNRRYEDNYK